MSLERAVGDAEVRLQEACKAKEMEMER